MMNALRISRQDLDDSSEQTDFQKHQQIVFRQPLQQTTNLYRQQELSQHHHQMKHNKQSNRYQRPDVAIQNYQADVENSSDFCGQQIDSHQPQIIDQDVEDFTRRLDMSIMAFRSQSLKDFMKIKRHLLKEQAEKIHLEKSKCDAMLSAKQNQIQQLKEELAHAYKQIQCFDSKTNSLSALTGKIKRNKRQMSLIMKLIQRWRQWSQRKKGNRFRIQNFTPRKKHLDLKIVFSSWTRYYRKNQNRIQTEQWEQKMKNRVGEVTMKYSKQIDSLKALLDETQKKLDAEQRKSLTVIDNLKKSMMRGMCAINFQAMNILDPNLQQPQQQLQNDSLSNTLANQQQPQNSMLHHPQQQQQFISNQNSIISPPGNSASQFDILGLNGISSTPQRSIANQSNIMTPNLETKQEVKQNDTFRTEPSTQLPLPSLQGGSYLPKQQNQLPQSIQGSLKIESKDHRWQPAPIFGKTFTGMQLNPSGTFGNDQSIAMMSMNHNNNSSNNFTPTSAMIGGNNLIQQQTIQPEQYQQNSNFMMMNNNNINTNNMFTSHTVDQILQMRRPKTSAPQTQQPPKSSVYAPTIQVDNAINPSLGGIANQLPQIGIKIQNQPVQTSGKTIRVNTKGKSYLSQEKKVNSSSKIFGASQQQQQQQSQQRPGSSRGLPKKGALKK